MRDDRPAWARRLEAYGDHILWGVAGFLLVGIGTEFVTGGNEVAVIAASTAGAAWGYRRAEHTSRR